GAGREALVALEVGEAVGAQVLRSQHRPLLEHQHATAAGHERVRERRPAGSAADDQELDVLLGHRYPRSSVFCPSAPSIARRQSNSVAPSASRTRSSRYLQPAAPELPPARGCTKAPVITWRRSSSRNHRGLP